MIKMATLIPLNPCYRRFPDVGTPSICYVKWFWSINQGGLVQVLEMRMLCEKTWFCEILRSDFQEWCFWVGVSDTNSSYTSFGVCLSGCLKGLANDLTKVHFCAWNGNDEIWYSDSVLVLVSSVFDDSNTFKTSFVRCLKCGLKQIKTGLENH